MASTSGNSSNTPTNVSPEARRLADMEAARERAKVTPDPNTWSCESWDTYASLYLDKDKKDTRISLYVTEDGCAHRPHQFSTVIPGLTYRVRIPAIMYVNTARRGKKEVFLPDVMAHFRAKEQCRHQFGYHIFVLKKGGAFWEPIDMMLTFWSCPDPTIKPDPMRRYLTVPPSPVCAIYPCYRPVPNSNNFEMVLGLCFTADLGDRARPRTFARHYFPKAQNNNNKWAFDITESFITKDDKYKPKDGKEWINYGSECVHPRKETGHTYTIAFYVCRGARLLVRDSRYAIDETGKQQEDPVKTGLNLDHTRSLFQQGSLLVVSGTVRAYITVVNTKKIDEGSHQVDYYNKFQTARVVEKDNQEEKDKNKSPDSSKQSVQGGSGTSGHEDDLVYARPFFDNRLLADFFKEYTKPHLDQMLVDSVEEKEWDINKFQKVKPLAHHFEKVIFLGAVESQYNSVCWSIKIDRREGEHHYHLEVPEGGVILDMSTWDAGFKQICARHRYEQLHKTVLPNDSIPESDIAQYTVPDQYFLKRILGLDNQVERNHMPATNSAVVNLDYKKLEIPQDYLADSKHDRDVRRYIANHYQTKNDPMFGYIERHASKPVTPEAVKWPLLTPPLYPPIKTSEQKPRYNFLKEGDKVLAVADISGKYNKYFQVKSGQNVSEQYYELGTTWEWYHYPWSPSLFGSDPKSNQNAVEAKYRNEQHCQRLGMDYLTHYKWKDSEEAQKAAAPTDEFGFTKVKSKKGKGKGKGGGGAQKTGDQTGSQQTTTDVTAVDFCKMGTFILTEMTADEVKEKIKKK